MEYEKIREIIATGLNLEKVEITEDTSLEDDLGADSLDIFQIVMALEEEFNVEFSSEDAENIKNVQDVIEYVKGKSE